LDVFPIHAGGGWIGMLLTGCFAEYVLFTIGINGTLLIRRESEGSQLLA